MLFVIRHETFQDKTNLYFVFEYLPGGNLQRLFKPNVTMANDIALFYAVEIVIALTYLHKRNIVFRDLRPESINIGADGHIKLSDFNFAKTLNPQILNGKTFTICGTLEYLAPEIVI